MIVSGIIKLILVQVLYEPPQTERIKALNLQWKSNTCFDIIRISDLLTNKVRDDCGRGCHYRRQCGRTGCKRCSTFARLVGERETPV